MWFDAALLAGNSKENLGNTMTDVVSYNILYEEHRQPNADDGIDKVEPVGTRHNKLMRQQMLYLPDEPLQQQTSKGSKDTDEEADEQHKVLVGQMPAPPSKQVGYEIPVI